MTSRIAFLGLGNMGLPMAANLVAGGHDVAGFDVVPAALDRARERGVPVVGSAREAVAGADVVLTMFPSGRHVLEAYAELLPAAPPGTLFLDCSTIDVTEARTAAEKARDAGHRALDAPVSGGVSGAEAATLTFMVGGPEAEFAAARPLLETMGRTIVHCGGPGAGQAAKVCNNLILGITMIGVSEAFVLAESLGLSHSALFDVASRSSGQCWALTSYCPVPGPVPASPANRDYAPGFTGALMAKDLGLALRAMEDGQVSAELGRLAERIYRHYAEGPGAGRDFSGIVTAIRAGEEL